MSDARKLQARITAFRQRLQTMPRLVPDPAAHAPQQPTDTDTLPMMVVAGSRTQAILEHSIRQLGGHDPVPQQPAATQLIGRARRVLAEAHELIDCLKKLADDTLLAGPPPEQSNGEADPLAIFYRETTSMMVPSIRLAQGMPDEPGIQSRLTEGLEAIFASVRQRSSALGHALEQRRRDAEQINRLAHLLVELASDRPIDIKPFEHLAAEIVAEGPAVPLRFVWAHPKSKQAYLGGPEFPAPARFVACHSLTTARVVARMLRMAPEWGDRPIEPILAALLHDVGMLRVPVDILASTKPLDDDQRRQIELHPRTGAELIAFRLPAFAHLVEGITSHHERLDGTGYPAGLKSDQIPTLAKLLAAADMYSALCCTRPQRTAHDPRTALTDTLLYAEQNILDRFAAEKLLALSFHPVGSVVEMSDGAIGVVAANRPAKTELHLASRPVLNLLIDATGHLLPVPLPIDLAECEGGTVIRTLPAEERARRLGRHYPEWAI